ncbi:MAG: hypothetical protein ACFFAY_10570 [Promethearchaeota archaeon]
MGYKRVLLLCGIILLLVYSQLPAEADCEKLSANSSEFIHIVPNYYEVEIKRDAPISIIWLVSAYFEWNYTWYAECNNTGMIDHEIGDLRPPNYNFPVVTPDFELPVGTTLFVINVTDTQGNHESNVVVVHVIPLVTLPVGNFTATISTSITQTATWSTSPSTSETTTTIVPPPINTVDNWLIVGIAFEIAFLIIAFVSIKYNSPGK